MSTSIFDLTDDQAIITEVIGYDSTRENYLSSVTDNARAVDLISYAQHNNDEALEAQINKAFKKELSLLFNE